MKKMEKILLFVGSISPLMGMAPGENFLKVAASHLPFNPFVPRTSWVVKKSVLSDALTPAMIKALSAIGVTFTHRTQISAPLVKKSLSDLQLREKMNVVSVPNFSIIVRAVPSEKGFEMNSLVAQELSRFKNKSFVPVKSALPTMRLSCVNRGSDFLLTMNSMQEEVVGGKARVQIEMGTTQATSWLRVTRPMLFFSLIDRLFRASLITSSGFKPVFGDFNYDFSVIVDRGLLCSVEQQTQTRNLETGSLFDVIIVDDAQTQTDSLKDQGTQTRNFETDSSSEDVISNNKLERASTLSKAERRLLVKKTVENKGKSIVLNKALPRKPAQIRSQSYCGIMEYIFLAIFFIMFGLSNYQPHGPLVLP